MYCKNCGTFLAGQVQCPNCGTGSQQVIPTGYNQPFNNYPQNIQSGVIDIDNMLIKAYIGEAYDKLVNEKFNWRVFLFSVLYLSYRKFYLYTLIMLILGTVFSFFNLSGLYIGVALLLGFLFNEFYIKKCKENVQKIKAENPGKSIEELSRICAKKGGVSSGSVVLTFLVLFGVGCAQIYYQYGDELFKEKKLICTLEKEQDGVSLKSEVVAVFGGQGIVIRSYKQTDTYIFEKEDEKEIAYEFYTNECEQWLSNQPKGYICEIEKGDKKITTVVGVNIKDLSDEEQDEFIDDTGRYDEKKKGYEDLGYTCK